MGYHFYNYKILTTQYNLVYFALILMIMQAWLHIYNFDVVILILFGWIIHFPTGLLLLKRI